MKQSMAIIRLAFFLLVSAALLANAADKENAKQVGKLDKYVCGSLVKDVYTDKAMYAPGNLVKITLNIKNDLGYDIASGKVQIQARHLNKSCGETIVKAFSLKKHESANIEAGWNPPQQDYQGYLLEVNVYDSQGRLLDTSSVGVDVSSSWVKFPRYGYLHDFGKEVDTAGKIAQMNRYHIYSYRSNLR